MSSSNTSTAEIDILVYTKIMFTRCWSFLLICLGIIGHALSIYVFTRPKFRSNPCTHYFLASTICGAFITCVNTPLRLLQTGYNIDLFGYSIVTCKLLTFVLYWSKALASWFIALASIDRFLCSSRSASLRAWSNIRVASWTNSIMTIMIGLTYIYVPILYELKAGHLRCPANQGSFAFFQGIWNLVVFSLGPPCIMFCFGSLTIHNIRQAGKRVIPRNNQINDQTKQPQLQLQNQKKTDRQLIQMMIVQCVYFSITSSLISINYIYMSVRPSLVLDALQVAKDDLFAQMVGTISITGACTSFYLFTLSSQLFRDELMKLFEYLQRPFKRLSENETGFVRNNLTH
ncbi:unnamed protein product [Adineta steineri]|uniref:G-protein coupled receptors family 1 profile domain-containing protein n=1 Tax=Adineta steineri TaxID=433720 RepID=A0A819UI39_9BILA|nr:unnamed protein product [Adineta steineri]CAF4092556.1 unnamed protein product [Adineta steineri]